MELFTKKNCQKALKNMVLDSGIRDPGSGKKPIPDPRSRGQKGTGSRIRIRNTGIKDPMLFKSLVPGSGMEKIRIRDGKNPNPGTEIQGNHPGSYFRKISNNF